VGSLKGASRPGRAGRRSVLAGALASLALAACGNRPEEPAPVVGRRGPDFTLTSLDGESVSLASLQGHPIVLNFFATWCIPCRSELPAFQEMARRHAERGLAVLLVDLQEDPGDVGQFLESLKVSLPAVVDDTGHVTKAYRVRGLPSTFFVDREGVIRAVQLGALDDRTLEGGIAKIV
jgi:cytochrome c biogenesis protein CcmG/thiol:disulfide interchange protein DsbE